MSNADQLKALLKSHREGDELHFYSVALQMAAMEARKGNGRVAEELKQMIDAAKSQRQS